MATKKKPTWCDCVEKVNEKLKETNTILVTAFVPDGEGDIAALPLIATQRIENLRNGKRATSVVATYCPFCGVRYPETNRKSAR